MVDFCRTKLIDCKLKELSEKNSTGKLKEEIKEIEKKPYVSLNFLIQVSKELNLPLNELLEKSSLYIEPVELKLRV